MHGLMLLFSSHGYFPRGIFQGPAKTMGTKIGMMIKEHEETIRFDESWLEGTVHTPGVRVSEAGCAGV